MRLRLLSCLVLLGCGGGHAAKSEPAAPAPAPVAAPAPAPTSAAPETSAAPVSAAPAAPAASGRLAPPQRWEELGHRGDETVLMGFVEWMGGEDVNIQVMGTMKMILEQDIAAAIKAKPDDPGGAIQGVIDELNQMMGDSKQLEWVRKSK